MRGVSKPEKFARAAGTEKNEKSTYTYVIVGGGTSGAVLASRLSEDPTKKVIVIEAGGSDQSLV